MVCIHLAEAQQAEEISRHLESAGIKSNLKGETRLSLAHFLGMIGSLFASPGAGESMGSGSGLVQILVDQADQEAALSLIEKMNLD